MRCRKKSGVDKKNLNSTVNLFFFFLLRICIVTTFCRTVLLEINDFSRWEAVPVVESKKINYWWMFSRWCLGLVLFFFVLTSWAVTLSHSGHGVRLIKKESLHAIGSCTPPDLLTLVSSLPGLSGSRRISFGVKGTNNPNMKRVTQQITRFKPTAEPISERAFPHSTANIPFLW